jgi:cell wall-associated NlpC family hydrolase
MPRPARTLLAACLFAFACALPATALAQTTGGATQPSSTGGTSYLPPAGKAKLMNGIAIPPADAPPQVVAAINAANQIVRKPYIYGGGHNRSFLDRGYDCSGSVSYALHGGGLLTQPLDSSDFMRWGTAGKGRWITVYTNPGHAFMMIAGLRFDTGFRDRSALHGAAPGSGPRWGHSRPTRGFKARHPVGF